MSDDLIKQIAVDFFRYWYNAPGANTEQGFDEWWSGYGESYNEELKQLTALREENTKLKREIDILRIYGNKDCTAMADEHLEGLNDESKNEARTL